MSGRAIEAAGDVDILMLDKTGTITLGNRQAHAFIPVDGVSEVELADAAQLSSLADETPEGRSVVILAKEKFGIRARDLSDKNMEFIPFTAKTVLIMMTMRLEKVLLRQCNNMSHRQEVFILLNVTMLYKILLNREAHR